MPKQVLGVIPARLASTRFPAKALAPLHGKPILQHVWERASQAKYLQHLLIATDDDTIATVARKFGAQVRMTFGPARSWREFAGEGDLTPGRALYQRVGSGVMREIAALKSDQERLASRGVA